MRSQITSKLIQVLFVSGLLGIGVCVPATTAQAQTPAPAAATTDDDIVLPPAKPMSPADVAAWEKKFIEDGDRDEKERAEQDKVKKEAKRAQCLKASCSGLASLNSPKSAPPACTPEDLKGKYKNAFCDSDGKFPNLFKLQDIARDGDESACYYYLEALGNKRIDEAIARDPKIAKESQISLPQQLWNAEKDCAAENLPSGGYYGLKAVMIGPGAEADGKKYCDLTASACMRAGGQERPMGGKLVCVAGGAVIDKSCIDKGKAGMVAASLANVKGFGTGCLAKDDMNPTYAKLLQEHLSGPPKTQICCGSGTTACTSPVSGFELPKEGAESDAFADANPPPGKGGTIRITESGFQQGGKGKYAINQASLNATLFHEFLHRVGLCTNKNHNMGGSNFRDQKADGSCSTEGTGFLAMEVGICSCNAGLNGSVIDPNIPNNCAYAGTNPKDVNSDQGYAWKCMKPQTGTFSKPIMMGRYDPPLKNPYGDQGFGKKTCIAQDGCNPGAPAPVNWGDVRPLYDSVYGCEYACYRTSAFNSAAGLKLAKSACRFGASEGMPIGTGATTCSASPELTK